MRARSEVGLSRLPVTEEIAGSNPVGPATAEKDEVRYPVCPSEALAKEGRARQSRLCMLGAFNCGP